jgi:hypothetical protein
MNNLFDKELEDILINEANIQAAKKKIDKSTLTMITQSDLIKLSYTEHGSSPIIGISNITQRFKEVYDILGKNFNIDTLTAENVEDMYYQKHWQQGSICNINKLKAFTKFFTQEEIAQILLCSPYSINTDIKEHYEEDKIHNFLNTIKMSLWHNGSGNILWNDIVNFNNECLSFNPFPDNDNISVGFDTTSWIPNAYGKTKYTKHPETNELNYIDGELAFIISYKGKLSFIISVDITSDKEIHIKQVQSLIYKRNKLRFILGDNFFELIIAEFVNHFKDYRVKLITGEGLIKQISNAGKDIKLYDLKAHDRIVSTYNQKFNILNRTKITVEYKQIGMSSSKMEFCELKVA